MTKEKVTLLERIRRSDFQLNGKHLKIFGCITMLCFTVAMSIFQNGFLHVNQYGVSELSAAIEADPNLTIMAGWTSVLQMIGSLSVPIFAFLLVEGFVHTSNFKRYLLSLLGYAVISEIPYDLAMYDRIWTLAGQNAMFTYVICLLMLYGLSQFVGKKGIGFRIMQLVILLAAILWNSLLNCAFGLVTILLTAVYYLLYERKGQRILLGCAVSVMYVTAPLSGFALWNYNGERGIIKNKYLFYALYPAHLLILGIIAHFLAV